MRRELAIERNFLVAPVFLFSLLLLLYISPCFDFRFNYRSTHHLVSYGFYNFLNWFDERAWYPLGRIVGGTVSVENSMLSFKEIFFFSRFYFENSLPQFHSQITIFFLYGLLNIEFAHFCEIQNEIQKIKKKKKELSCSLQISLDFQTFSSCMVPNIAP